MIRIRLAMVIALFLLAACKAPTPAPTPTPAPVTERRDAGIPAVATVLALLHDEAGWWAGTYERVGLWHSPDEGATWQEVAGVPSPVHDLVRADGARWAATGDGLWRDAGAGWHRVEGLPEDEALSLAADGDTLYVTFGLEGVWRVEDTRVERLPLDSRTIHPAGGALSVAARGAWLLVGTSGRGVWQSTDGGTTWAHLPFDEAGFALVVGIAETGEAWARTRRGLWRSADSGATWLDAALPDGAEVMALTVGAGGPWAGSADGRLFRWDSEAWQPLGPAMPTPLPIIEISSGPRVLLVGRQDGIWRLDGDRWMRAGNLGEVRIEALSRLPDGTLLAGHLDGVYRSTDGGATWQLVRVGEGYAVAALASDPHAPQRVWLGTPPPGSGLWRSEDGGATWDPVTNQGSAPVRALTAFFPDPQQAGRLLAKVSYDRFYEWRDATEGWESAWRGIPSDVEGFALAFDPDAPDHQWAGTASGLFERRGDEDWQRIAPELSDQTVMALLPDAGGLWVGATRGLYRVEGATVRPSGLHGLSVRAVARHEGRLYAGSRQYGLLVEAGDGTWTQVVALGERTVHALVPAPEGLWAATSDGLWLVRPGGEVVYRSPMPIPVPEAQPLTPTDAPALFVHLLNPSDALFREAAARGAWGVVLLPPWRDIEPNPNEWHWEKMDSWMQAARFYGLEVVLRLDQSPAWSGYNPSDLSLNPLPRDWGDYAEYATQIATRYRGQVRGYVLWNEPNLALDWGHQRPDPAGYLKLLRATVPALRAADPDALIAAGALAPTTRDDAVAMDDLRYLEALLAGGAGDLFDVLAVHPYPFGLPPAAPADANGGLTLNRLAAVRALMTRYGQGDKPMWATEFGYSVGDGALGIAIDEAQRAAWLGAAMHHFATQYPQVGLVAMWNLSERLPSVDEKLGYNLVGDEAAWAALAPSAGGPHAGQAVPPVALAADSRVHLGDSELPPPWWPLFGGVLPSSRWENGFYLNEVPDGPRWLLLELFQANEAGNELRLNGVRLHTEALPVADFTAQWVTVRLRVEPTQLRAGWNTVAFRAGHLTPAFQQPRYLWDDVMIRNVRLEE